MSSPNWNKEGRDWPNRAHSRFINAGGINWHVQIAGQGPAVLLLHGTGAATHSWRSLLPILAKDFTVIAPDLPGHAFTSGHPNQLTLANMASGAAALLTELGVSPALIIGHSAGAAIAVHMVTTRMCAPRAIVAVNGALLPFPGLAAKLFPAMAQMLFVNPFMPRLFALQAAVPGGVERFMKRSTGSAIDPVGLRCYEALFRSSGHCAGALGMMANWDLTKIKGELATLSVPLVLVYGDKDTAVPPKVSLDVAKIVPRSHLIAMKGLGHLAPEENPDQFARIVTSVWQDGLEPRPTKS